MHKHLFSVIFSTITMVGFAQAPKYSNEFMAIGVGANAMGRSNTTVATVNDVSAGYWNPAGLVNIKSDVQVAAMHAEYFAGIAKFDYGGFAFKIDSVSSFSTNVIRFGVDDIPNTINLIDESGNINYDNITTFSAADYGFLFSYARKLKTPGLSVGATAKVIHRKVGSLAKAWGFGVDVSAQYQKNNWRFGLIARDITTTVNAWSYSLTDRIEEVWQITGNEIPTNSTEVTLPRVILGAAYNFQIGENFELLAEVNTDLTTDGQRNVLVSADPISVDPHAGIEANYKKLVFLRLGIGNIQKEKNDLGNRSFTTVQPNAGIGVQIKQFSIDYALTDIGDQSAGLYSHVFSLKYDIYRRK